MPPSRAAFLKRFWDNQRLENCRRVSGGMPGAYRQRRWAEGPAAGGAARRLLTGEDKKAPATAVAGAL